MLVVFGLGNPGPKYRGTRHNAGYETIELVATSCRKHLARRLFSRYMSCEIEVEGRKARLVFPLTFMNNSGEIVSKVVKPGDEVLVVCDQMDLPPGRIRLRSGGGSAGHNGLKSMLEALPGNFTRLYIGVGRPEGGTTVIEHVLAPHSPGARALVDKAEEEAAKIVLRLVKGDDFGRVVQEANSFVAED